MPIAAFERTLFHHLFFSGRCRYIVPIASCLGWDFLIQLSQQAWFPLHYSMLPCHCIRYCYPQSKPSSCFFTYISSFKLVKTIQDDSWQTSRAHEALKWSNFGTGIWIRNKIRYDAYDDGNAIMTLFTRNTALPCWITTAAQSGGLPIQKCCLCCITVWQNPFTSVGYQVFGPLNSALCRRHSWALVARDKHWGARHLGDSAHLKRQRTYDEENITSNFHPWTSNVHNLNKLVKKQVHSIWFVLRNIYRVTTQY